MNLVARFCMDSIALMSFNSSGLQSCEQYVIFDLTNIRYRFFLIIAVDV